MGSAFPSVPVGVQAAATAVVVPLLVIAAFVVGTFLFICFAYLRRAFLLAAERRARLAPLRLLSLIAREAWASVVVVGWAVVRRGERLHRDGDGSGPPVVLVHGISADGTCLSAFRAALHALGRPTAAPHLGTMFRSVERYAERLAAALDEVLLVHPGQPLQLVCHSMGGVVLRACLHARPDLASHVERVITIASPHKGTLVARGLPLPEGRELVPDSAFLQRLPSLHALVPDGARVLAIASRHDAVVYPHETSEIDERPFLVLDEVGHAELLVHPRVHALVLEELQR